MNFLAHIYLSGDNDQMMIGNFIGDFVRGRDLSDQFDSAIVKGIELHRAIDAYTDQHEIVLESKKRLRPKYRHYSGVIVDMYYDHFLASNWEKFHSTSLPEYANHFYELLKENESILPQKVQHLMHYMIRGNWLLNYSKTEGIGRALSGMSRRTPYDSKMDEATIDLRKHYDAFEDEFNRFFPHLENFSTEWIKSN